MKKGINKPHIIYHSGLWRCVQIGKLTTYGGTPTIAIEHFRYYNNAAVLR